jgi:hypothetical protein
VVKSFFFFSLALCIQNKSSGSCCNYLRVYHTPQWEGHCCCRRVVAERIQPQTRRNKGENRLNFFFYKNKYNKPRVETN